MENRYQRSELRASVYGGGSLTWDDAGEGSRTSSVIVRNLSEQGIQVLCHRAIRTGAVVFLTGETYECLGKVRYCVYGEDGYRIGIQFTREPYPRNRSGKPI
jgi:hypothetical protein